VSEEQPTYPETETGFGRHLDASALYSRLLAVQEVVVTDDRCLDVVPSGPVGGAVREPSQAPDRSHRKA
jgi:hypothetical protein